MEKDIVQNQISNLPDFYRDFFYGDLADEIPSILTKGETLDGGQFLVIKNAFDLYLLFLLDDSDLKSFLIQEAKLSEDRAGALASAMKMSLPQSIKDFRDAAIAEADKLIKDDISEHTTRSVITTNVSIKGITGEALESDIIETEQALEKLSSVRTMATDMATAQGETVHISNQDNVLAQKSSSPRWDTDN